jgi:DNA-binding transcriptional LysR family regulator
LDTEGWQGESPETIRQMVVSGVGITVPPCSAITPKHRNKRLIAITVVVRHSVDELVSPGGEDSYDLTSSTCSESASTR